MGPVPIAEGTGLEKSIAVGGDSEQWDRNHGVRKPESRRGKKSAAGLPIFEFNRQRIASDIGVRIVAAALHPSKRSMK